MREQVNALVLMKDAVNGRYDWVGEIKPRVEMRRECDTVALTATDGCMLEGGM